MSDAERNETPQVAKDTAAFVLSAAGDTNLIAQLMLEEVMDGTVHEPTHRDKSHARAKRGNGFWAWILRLLGAAPVETATAQAETGKNLHALFETFRIQRQRFQSQLDPIRIFLDSPGLQETTRKKWTKWLDKLRAERSSYFVSHMSTNDARPTDLPMLRFADTLRLVESFGVESPRFTREMTRTVRSWLRRRFFVLPGEPCLFGMQGDCFWLLLGTYHADERLEHISNHPECKAWSSHCVKNVGDLSVFEQWLLFERLFHAGIEDPDSKLAAALLKLPLAKTPRYSALFKIEASEELEQCDLQWIKHLANDQGWEVRLHNEHQQRRRTENRFAARGVPHRALPD